MKTCKECSRELDETCYSITRGINGETYLRNTCKECLKQKRRGKPKTQKTFIPTESKIIEKRPPNMTNNNFTDKEILEIILNKDNRIHTVFNLNQDIREKIKALADDKKINMSDAANLIFKKFFQTGN